MDKNPKDHPAGTRVQLYGAGWIAPDDDGLLELLPAVTA